MTNLKEIHIHMAKAVFILFIFLKASSGYSQVYGCTDPTANNYNSSATVNDGSCTYNITNYIPPIIVDPISDTLKESSGLQWAGNSVWSFNDRGGTPDLYRIDTASGVILQTLRLTGASNVDWEELTFDGTYFYVGDFGNNLDGSRTDLKIYKFRYDLIPDYTTNPDAAIDSDKIDIINFKYIDQPQPPVPVALDSTKFDCEAMIISDGKIHLFTKDWITYTSTHYVINSTLPGDYIATPVDTLNTGYLVTAASKVPNQEKVVLLGYLDAGFGNHYMYLLFDYSNGKYFNGNKRKISLPTAAEMGQAEGITFRTDDYGYISNERFKKTFGTTDIIVNQKLRSFDISGFVPATVLAIDLTDFNVTKINGDDKIIWSFSSPVRNVRIEQSIDGVHFTTLKTYSISNGGTYLSKPVNSINYYRIGWQKNSGALTYSKIISIRNDRSNQISNILLKANGELSFMLGGSEGKVYSFALLTTDGKELSQIAPRSYKPGFNTINFSSNVGLNNVVIVAAYGNRQKITTMVHVVK